MNEVKTNFQEDIENVWTFQNRISWIGETSRCGLFDRANMDESSEVDIMQYRFFAFVPFLIVDQNCCLLIG